MSNLINELYENSNSILGDAVYRYRNYLHQGKLKKCQKQMETIMELADHLELAEEVAESDEDMQKLEVVEDLIRQAMEHILEDTDETFSNDEPELVTVVNDQKPGRNDPCSCGSGLKFKKCCGA
jgi:uncharacterized protein YecA (UPF0149 family)